MVKYIISFNSKDSETLIRILKDEKLQRSALQKYFIGIDPVGGSIDEMCCCVSLTLLWNNWLERGRLMLHYFEPIVKKYKAWINIDIYMGTDDHIIRQYKLFEKYFTVLCPTLYLDKEKSRLCYYDKEYTYEYEPIDQYETGIAPKVIIEEKQKTQQGQNSLEATRKQIKTLIESLVARTTELCKTMSCDSGIMELNYYDLIEHIDVTAVQLILNTESEYAAIYVTSDMGEDELLFGATFNRTETEKALEFIKQNLRYAEDYQEAFLNYFVQLKDYERFVYGWYRF